MTQADMGSKVKVHYTCKLDDGALLIDSREQEPIEFTVGQDQVLPGIEEAVKGMQAGESKTIQIPPDKAFGPRREELLQEVPRDQLPDDINPQVGQRLTVNHADGQSTTVTVAGVSESSITLDANHPLADTNLSFELELLEVG